MKRALVSGGAAGAVSAKDGIAVCTGALSGCFGAGRGGGAGLGGAIGATPGERSVVCVTSAFAR